MYNYIHTVIFIFDIFIFGRGGYTNAQPAKSYFLLFNLAAALSGNGPSAKSKCLTTSASLIPNLKIIISVAAAAEILFLTCVSYHGFFNTKNKYSAAAAAEVLVLLAIIIYLIPYMIFPFF